MAQVSRQISQEPCADGGRHSFPAKVLQEERNLTRASHPALAMMVSSVVNMVQKGSQDGRHI
ncbi:MAG: hypothetical protein F4026_01745 [Synechococcus sp. SB0669_bin_8]|nr:hypothetical protein [Synechococcus sp. SB0663_bin_10]MYG45893.1 hypothetical protein [Synechococcus sp. SB0675_bin_6]MYJ60494.1 hypothetical protein [Synechococcus sp. SB0672_bin_6]MYK90862.1 hypothetical protein [Synechococcus sp. SB0669_bin_8]